jgi:hypothetical protein
MSRSLNDLAYTKILFTKSSNAKLGLMSKKQSTPKFQIGDRVAEKPKPRAIYAKTAATIERIKPYTAQRYGTVLDTVYQGAKGKPSVPYVKIIWDGTQTPVTHAQCRICLEKDLTAVTIDYFNARD